MAMVALPKLKIDRNDPKTGLHELIKIIKPSWTHEKLVVEPLTGGYSCKIFKCFDEADKKDALTVRIRNLVEYLPEFQHFSKDIEMKTIQNLSEIGHFPRVLASFATGYCYEYIKGKAMADAKTMTGYVDEEMLESITKELVAIHSVKLIGEDYTEETFIKNMGITLSLSQLALEHELAPTKEVLVQEFKVVDHLLKQLNCPLGLCHGDLHPGNIIWNTEKKKATIVDWEVAHIGYKFLDIARFLQSFSLFDPATYGRESKLKFPSDVDNKFITYYLKEFCHKQNEDYNDEKLNEYKDHVEKLKLASTLIFLTVSLLFPAAINNIFGDIKSTFKKIVEQYLRCKQYALGYDTFEKV